LISPPSAASETGRSVLSTQEIESAISAFSPAEWAKADRMAQFFANNLPGMTGEDLLQEAMVKFLAGERVWPTDLPSLIVLKNAMRSIASNERKKYLSVDANIQIGAPESGAELEDTREFIETTSDITPLDILDGQRQLEAAYAQVAGDEDAELVLMAWADSMRGKEAAEAVGLDAKRYDAARNRLIRKLAPLGKLRDTK
jgi:DNA-directed RNA polymerase specialized sigma24 family protein